MEVKAFLCQHKAENYENCEDRFCVNIDTKSVAVADGMSQSFLPEYWADLICRRFSESTDGWYPTHESVQELEPSWNKLRDIYADLEEKKNNPYSYLIRNSIAEKKSAACTFVGIRFLSSKELKYHILGDSSMIIFREGKLKSEEDIFSTHRGKFDSFPDFFDSNHLRGGKGDPVNDEIQISDKDTILLVTDPFSDFFYEKAKSGNDCSEYLQEVKRLNSHDDYVKLVEKWRNEGMHDDDSTLVVIIPNDKDTVSIAYEDKDPSEDIFIDKTSQINPNFWEAQPKGKSSHVRENDNTDREIVDCNEFQNFIDEAINKHGTEEHGWFGWLKILFNSFVKLKKFKGSERKRIKKMIRKYLNNKQ